MYVKILPPTEIIRQLLDYDAETGALTWRKRENLTSQSWNARYAGKIAFTAKNKRGYHIGQLNSTPYMAHRLIWKLMTGEEPDTIDHIDGNPSNNRFSNLRSVDAIANGRNRKTRIDVKHGRAGITRTSNPNNPWQAAIGVKGKVIYLGAFATKDEAIEARIAAEVRHQFIQR